MSTFKDLIEYMKNVLMNTMKTQRVERSNEIH